MSIDPQEYKDVMARFAAGVTIVTALKDGQPHGMTVSSFTSVSLQPPMVLICVDKTYGIGAEIEAAKSFAVNILHKGQADLGLKFAQPDISMADRFAAIEWSSGKTKSPILKDCLSWLDCTLHHQHNEGDHTIFFGKVTDCGTVKDAAPLLYQNRDWCTIKELPGPHAP